MSPGFHLWGDFRPNESRSGQNNKLFKTSSVALQTPLSTATASVLDWVAISLSVDLYVCSMQLELQLKHSFVQCLCAVAYFKDCASGQCSRLFSFSLLAIPQDRHILRLQFRYEIFPQISVFQHLGVLLWCCFGRMQNLLEVRSSYRKCVVGRWILGGSRPSQLLVDAVSLLHAHRHVHKKLCATVTTESTSSCHIVFSAATDCIHSKCEPE